MFGAIFVPAEIGCELHEGERVAHLVSLYLGPNSWRWGGGRGWSTMVGAMRKGGMCDMSWVAPIVTLLFHMSLIYDRRDPTYFKCDSQTSRTFIATQC